MWLWGRNVKQGGDGGSEFAPQMLVCAGTCQAGRGMGPRAAGSSEPGKWLVPKFWQKTEEKEGREEEGGRGVVVWAEVP